MPEVEEQKPGIVASAADEYKAKEVAPITTQVDAGTETVESRLNKLTAGDSAYVNQARRDTQRAANDRGLINSSIAAGAGQEAAIREALPIAQQDAKTYTDTRMNNQNSENDFLKNTQSAELNKDVAAHGSRLAQNEAEVNNDLTMTRDAALAEDTQEQATLENQLSITRDNNNADLNKSIAEFESSLKMGEMKLDSELKKDFEGFMNDAKFSDEIKLQAVTTMNTITRDANDQIVQIGLSDRSAAQQTQAIQLVNDNRDASLAVYQDLLGMFDDWEWGTDFTPEQNTTASTNNYWNAPDGVKLASEPAIGTVIGGQKYDGNGKWSAYTPDNQNSWNDY